MSSDRMPPIPPEQWSEEQNQYAQEIIRGPRGALIAPFIPLMRSPELMAHAQRMGEYLRYRSALPLRLSELAILVTANCWSQAVEWEIHEPIARSAGVGADTIAAIAEGKLPQGSSEDEWLVASVCFELHQTQRISDATWQAAIELLGERGVMDLIGITGYYTLLAMVMNAARTPLPSAATAMPP